MSESVMIIHKDGTKLWRNEKGQLHRTVGPAIEWYTGSKEWIVRGKPHRLNGPAIEHPDGSKSWYVNGEWLGSNDKGFWRLWDRLTPEQKQDPTLISYLPGDFNV